MVDIDNNRPNERKQGPPLLPNLATRINKYWKIEAESHSTVKHLKGLYSTPENCWELVVPKINRELYTKLPELHPYYIRQDRKYIELQETLMAVTTAVSSIANLALEADKNSEMVDTKQIVTHALNATTLLGCAHQKLNNRRKESIAPALPKEIREVCSSQREVTSWLFGNDLAQAIKEAKEINKLSNEIATGKKYSKRQFENPRSTQPQRGPKRPKNNFRQPAQQNKGFQQGRKPRYREKPEHP